MYYKVLDHIFNVRYIMCVEFSEIYQSISASKLSLWKDKSVISEHF